jgi:Ricin-type beta-trefoil lectin domain
MYVNTPMWGTFQVSVTEIKGRHVVIRPYLRRITGHRSGGSAPGNRLFRTAVLASAVSAALVVFGLAPAAHAAVPLSGVVSPTPVSWTPNVFAGTTNTTVCDQWFGSGGCGNATVYSTAIVNGEVVVAGAFTQVCQSGPAKTGHCLAGTTVTRNDIFAYQLGTGTIDPNFAPQFDQGPAYAVAAGPNNTVYVGGAFTTVNGQTSNNGVVQLNVTPGNAATDGQVVTAFGGKVNNTVYSLALNGNALYIGGQFSVVDSTTKEAGIARLNATTGAVDSTFGISVSTPVVSGISLKVAAMSLSADGGTLAIAGTFADVNGLSRPRVALIGTGGGLGSAASVENWAALPILSNNCSAEHDYVRGIDLSPDGSFLVIADTGYKSDGSTNPSACDATARFPTAATGTNIAPTWINYTGGDSFYSVQITGAVVYVGGHNRWVNNECGNNHACEANSVLVMGFAAIDANTGLAVPWFHPMTLRGNGVVSLTAFPAGEFSGSQGGVLLGDNVTTNGQGGYHSFEALFPLTSTTASPTFGSIPSGLFLTGRVGGSDESTKGVAAMCVDDTGNSSTPGTKVEISTCTNGAEQNWTVQTNGTITVNGLCLDTSGTSVIVNTCSGGTSQQWTQGAGNTLVNQASSLCLTDPGSVTKPVNGTALDVASCTGAATQVWPLPAAPLPASLTPVGAISASVPSSTSQPSCITDTGDSTTSGTAAEMSLCLDSQAQDATINANGTIQIQGLCLDTSGSNVVLNTCSGATSQVWTSSGSGNTLVNSASSQCLEATSQSNNAALTTASCSSSNVNQQWWLPAV